MQAPLYIQFYFKVYPAGQGLSISWQGIERDKGAERKKGFIYTNPVREKTRTGQEEKSVQTCDDLGGSNGNFKGALDAVEVFAAVVEADDRLCTDCDTDQNGQHDLVDFHDDAHGGQRNLGAVNRSRAVDGEQVVEECHYDGNCNLGDEAADT